MKDEFFRSLKATFDSRIGRRPRPPGDALALSRLHPSAEVFGSALVRDMHTALDGKWWTAPDRRVASNWSWRKEVGGHKTESKEVRLERAVCEGRLATWTYQMPTSSGLRGRDTDKRRCIDLVRMVSPKSFEFIELKVGSDDPPFAVQEIVGYGLAYLHARSKGYERLAGDTKGVLQASSIALVVLGPDQWYRHWFERKDAAADLHWLVGAVNLGLDAERQRVPGLERFSLSLRSFSYDAGNPGMAAETIARTGGNEVLSVP